MTDTLQPAVATPFPSVDLRPTDWTVTHDFAFVFGGAEWVTRVLSEQLLPGSTTKVLTGDPTISARLNAQGAVTQVLPEWVNKETYRLATPLYPRMISRLPRIEGNVLASSYAFAHHLRGTGRTVVYCHSPLRQAWTGSAAYQQQGPVVERAATRLLGANLRRRDSEAAAQADTYIATSRAVQRRLAAFYGRDDAPIIPPPVDDSIFYRTDTPREDFYLFVGRITEPYKQLGLLLRTFGYLPRKRLVVVGDGRDRARLEARAPGNVTFLGWQSPTEVAALYNRARALIFPSEDDFGLVPVEAMSCGLPVIAYGAGGALDTVEAGTTGLFFHQQTPVMVTKAITEFEALDWDEELVIRRAARFSRAAFLDRMREALADA
ncbi:glycosyltransferase [Spongisporangium articulatum]|uniref:Glycosyltransferase n=1 Tax=Spongisporangium articulatum TaxID=3362603 RepID=A0ABW8AT34_9ACTN